MSDVGKIGKELHNEDALASPEWIVEWYFTRKLREEMELGGLTDAAQTLLARKLVELNAKKDMYRIIRQGADGTINNGRFLVIRYYNEMFWLLRFMCRLTASLEITVHPVYYPSAEEVADPTLYCANVQSYIERALLCGASGADGDCVDLDSDENLIRVVEMEMPTAANAGATAGGQL